MLHVTSWVVRAMSRQSSGMSWHRNRAATLVGRVELLLARILVVMALPLDVPGKLRILLTEFYAAWYVLRFLLSISSLQKFRSTLLLRLGPIGCLWHMQVLF